MSLVENKIGRTVNPAKARSVVFSEAKVTMAQIWRAPFESTVLEAPLRDPRHRLGRLRGLAPPRLHDRRSRRCGRRRGCCRCCCGLFGGFWPGFDQFSRRWPLGKADRFSVRGHRLLHGPDCVLKIGKLGLVLSAFIRTGSNFNEWLIAFGLIVFFPKVIFRFCAVKQQFADFFDRPIFICTWKRLHYL